MATLHSDLTPLAHLLGTWSGSGHGTYPTIEAFDYDETVTFGHAGKPFLSYAQRTTATADGRPLHAESGFWRARPPDRIEIIVAHAFGVVEVCEGSITVGGPEELTIAVSSTTVAGSATAKEVTEITRVFVVDGDRLDYDVSMAAVGQPLTHHLSAVLRRVGD